MTTTTPTRARWIDAVVLMLCQSSQSLIIGGLALFLPLIRADLGVTFTQAGALGAASTLIYALMQIPSGLLADRIDPRRVFLIGMVGVNVLALAFALFSDYGVLLITQAVSGLFRALVFAPGLLLMVALFPLDRRATALGLFVAGGFSGSVLLNLVGPLLVDPLGWRLLFAAFSALGGVVLAVFWRRSARLPAQPRPTHVPLREAVQVLRHRAMWAVAGIQYIRLAVVFGIATWLPTFIVDDRGHSLQVAGAVVALSAALTAPSNFLGGYLSDRLRRPLLIIGGSLTMLAITTFLLPRVDGIVVLVGVIAVNAVFVQLYFGPLFAVPVELFGTRSAGFITGFGNFFANLGAFTFVYTLGAIKDATGSFTIGFDLLAGACVIGVALSALLATARRRALATPSAA